MKKILAMALVVVMMMALSVTAFAQTVNYTGTDGDGATITITNAASGETYKVAKLFDATVTGAADGSVAYTGTIPPALTDYFEYVNGTDGSNGIIKKVALNLSDAAVQAALKTWAEANVSAQADSDGSELSFTNLPYGYYIITTTQGETLLTVDSTNPNASVIDKNTTPPINNASKTADDDDVFIGQTVTYTVSFNTANYSSENGGSKQIVKYIIEDNFANGALENVTVTSIKVIDGTDETTLTAQQFNAAGKIEIAWVDGANKSLYPNGAKLEITYTATVAASAAIDGAGSTNTVTLDYKDEDNNGSPSSHTVTETIYTYAVAIQKVNQSGTPLAGAKFQLPFYVKDTADTDGAYIYAGTTAGTGLVNELTTPASGLIIIKGVEEGTYSFTETEAPAGYNKLGGAVTVTATQTGSTTTSATTYLDADGNVVSTSAEASSTVAVSINALSAGSTVVVNKTGPELPSTGGIGTTIFYVIGSVLVVGAVVALVSKKRMEE